MIVENFFLDIRGFMILYGILDEFRLVWYIFKDYVKVCDLVDDVYW